MCSDIKPFYSNAHVLITGGTGLFGKLLIQKLLRTCDDIGGIYLIIRGKKGKSATERIEEECKDPIFDKIRTEKPEFAKKIYVLEGDCSKLGLGLNQPNRNLLIDKINVVFHCAASLNMDSKMKDAVDTNIRGLSELLDVCHEMRYLKSLMFVSTAYSNCTQYVIEEKFYVTPIQATTLLKLTDEVDEKVLDDITPRLIGKWPNTYCYTKAVAENLFYNKTKNLPVGVFRPSIVLPTFSDPVPGWTANVYGPVGLWLAAALGVLRVAYCDANKRFDFVPADFCINALICTAWKVHKKNTKKLPEEQISVYNYSGGAKRNMTWEELMHNSEGYEYPFKNPLWITTIILTSNQFYYNFLWLFLHIIPGCFLDAYLFITGQKPRLINAYKKVWKFSKILAFFTTREWDIKNKNIYYLWNQLTETDRELFPFDMDVMNYREYIQKGCLGVKLYIMKENLDNAEAEKKYYQKLLKIHQTVKAVFMLVLLLSSYKFISWFIGILLIFFS